MSECQSVVKSSQMTKNVDQSDKQCNRNNRMATDANNELLSNSKGVVMRARFHNDHTQTDKYCLELQTTLKGEKCVWQKISANEWCIQQNTPMYNGVSFFQHIPSKVVHLDACPHGLGAIFVYALPLQVTYQQLNIAYLEMLNILVALKVWHCQWAGLKVQVKCDHQAVVSVLNSGRSHDPVMAEYARNIFTWVSTFNIYLKVVHVPGKLNEVADLLSRWFITTNNFHKLQQLVNPVVWIPVSNALLYTDKTI